MTENMAGAGHEPVSVSDVRVALRELAETATRTADLLADDVARAATMVRDTVRAGGTLFFCGNGGSAADAQHMATEYVVRYRRNRRAYPAIALTTDTSLLTAAGNDFGFEHVFSRQVEALCRPGDLLIIHSTSGSSPNVLEAARAARAKGVRVLALTARDGGPLRALADHNVIVPTDRTDRAQELHLCIQHLICDLVEQEL
ncbi:MAG: D-sedoheptulose-7-phosphate isomerase [Gemmatirosa sp.]